MAKLVIDACLFGEDDLQMLFSVARGLLHGATWKSRRPSCSSCAR
jgi:hypothetical protein